MLRSISFRVSAMFQLSPEVKKNDSVLRIFLDMTKGA